MMANDSRLQQRFVQAIDDVVPPAPWLETQVVEALQHRPRSRRFALGVGSLGGFPSGFRLAAGLVALLIAVATVGVLLMSSNLHGTTVPGGRTTPVQTPLLPPAGLMSAAVVYDTKNRTVVVFGGYSFNGIADSNGETWTWDGTAWRGHKPVTSPSPRYGAAMAYDEARGVSVMFGGSSVTGGNAPVGENDTWIWDGRTWRQLHPAQRPPAMNGPVMAYDRALSAIVLFGNGETWTWDGSTWKQLHPQGSPLAMAGYQKGLAYHAVTQTLLLFGNQVSGGAPISETWTFDGSTWARHPASSGSAPSGILPSMAADDARGTVVLVDEQGETWTWDGRTWSQQHPSSSPPPRAQEVMAYDADRQVVVLFGGYHKPLVADTWIWDGSTWTRRT